MTGNIIIAAITLGSTKNPAGSRGVISRASICSVIFILPISAAIEAPIFPARTKDNIIGASSITVDLKITFTVKYLGIIPED